MSQAEFRCEDGFVVGALSFRLYYAPAVVWRAMTDPARLAEWLAPGRIEPRLGGHVRLDFEGSGTVIDSEVAAFEDGRLVEFSWSRPGEPARPVRWTLALEGADTQLTVSVGTPPGEDPAKACAGWAAHVTMLEAALAGAPIAFPFERFKTVRETFGAALADLA
ncbi:MAG TPA: SRPBCC domain-containing protein [Caulobacteraceae bacterium]|jgi:uncharacterized protein YndB with AHSA1/START domain